jgi:hypothetical protein
MKTAGAISGLRHEDMRYMGRKVEYQAIITKYQHCFLLKKHIKIINMLPERIKLILLSIIISTAASGQNDTTVYYSRSYSAVNSLEDAASFQTFKKNSKNSFVLTTFMKNDQNWDKLLEEKIRRHSDTSFYIFSSNDDYIRFYKKVIDGFLIHDVLIADPEGTYHTYYNWEGLSKTLFPLIRTGVWRAYSSFTGDLQFEEGYDNNRLIDSKYWINDSSYIKDVFHYLSEPAKFQGGQDALKSLIYNNMNYPGGNHHGKVIVSFVILSNGQITAIKPLNNIDQNLTREVIRVVNLTRTKWTPAKIGDKNVNSVAYFPIYFKLM